ncbi:MAG: hypothetical protein HW380_781 [Magnetococcales bacterium]|nr:hypothetical protein [Magnetococcales bacterium]HIJ82683.1 hypothetical protein [Magnetococcales bacterium]
MKTPSTIHITYLIVIALTCFGAIVTIDFGDIDFLRRLTYAMIISALAISILSIVYVFLSNTTIPTMLKDVERISNQIQESAHRMDVRPDVAREFDTLSKLIREESQRLSSEMHSLTLLQGSESEGGRHDQTGTDQSELPMRVLDTSAPMGLVLLYAAVLAFGAKKSLDLADLCQSMALPPGSEFYFQGWILAMTATGLLATRFDDQMTAKVEYVHPSLLEGIRERIPKKIAQLKLESNATYATEIATTITRVEEYFASKKT